MMNKKASSEHFSGTKTEEVNPDRERIQLLWDTGMRISTSRTSIAANKRPPNRGWKRLRVQSEGSPPQLCEQLDQTQFVPKLQKNRSKYRHQLCINSMLFQSLVTQQGLTFPWIASSTTPKTAEEVETWFKKFSSPELGHKRMRSKRLWRSCPLENHHQVCIQTTSSPLILSITYHM